MYGIHTINHILPWILFTCSLFQILKFISFLLVVFCLYWSETHTHTNTRTCKVTLRHKMPQSRESCPGKLLTARGFALPASRSPSSQPPPCFCCSWASSRPAFHASAMKCLQPQVPLPAGPGAALPARPCSPTLPGRTLRSSQVAATFHTAEPIPTDSSMAWA